jgi:uncharacterized protein
MLRRALLAVALFSGCGSAPTSAPALQNSIPVTLPGGVTLRAELKTDPADMARGMMFRDQLPPDRAMLFVHQTPGRYPYWMHNVRVPLDILWLDSARVVEISADTPPCLKPASDCPNYGGHSEAQYVLELAGGQAKKLGLSVGQQLHF